MVLATIRRIVLIRPNTQPRLFIGGILTALILGSAWTDPGDRQTLYFSPIPGPILNPLMGWAPWATLDETQQPHTLVYADLTWREFEPLQGVYAFEAFEKKQQFARWRKENQRVVFRFLIDVPNAKRHMDIPNWLYDEIGGEGDFYDTEYGKGFSPDYANPRLIERHRQAIQALGRRYGKDGFFAYIELGSLGHWGEWHVRADAGIRQLPPAEVRNKYVQAYRDAFPTTKLLMRRPFAIASQLNLGLYNDMTGSAPHTKEWLEWITNGGIFDQTGEPNALVPMPDAWKIAPVGGEQASTLRSEEVYGWSIDTTLQLVDQSHMTFIGPNGPYAIDIDGAVQQGIDRVLEHLGYRIYIQQAEMPRLLSQKQRVNITLYFANDGAAPMYYNWPVKAFLFDMDGIEVKTYKPKMDLRQILPGTLYRVSFTIPTRRLEEGIYTLGIAILDPLTGQPAVRFAMDNPRGDLIQEIGKIEVHLPVR